MLGRLVSFLFNAGMAAYFVYAFFFPAETQQWLALQGQYVLLTEMFSILTAMFLAEAMQTDPRRRIYEITRAYPVHPGFFLAAVFTLAFYVLFSYRQSSLVAYFVMSVGVKAASMVFTPDFKAEITQTGQNMILLIFGAMASVVVSRIFLFVFVQRIVAITPTDAFVLLWGLVYFVGLAVLSLKPEWLPVPIESSVQMDERQK